MYTYIYIYIYTHVYIYGCFPLKKLHCCVVSAVRGLILLLAVRKLLCFCTQMAKTKRVRKFVSLRVPLFRAQNPLKSPEASLFRAGSI